MYIPKGVRGRPLMTSLHSKSRKNNDAQILKRGREGSTTWKKLVTSYVYG